MDSNVQKLLDELLRNHTLIHGAGTFSRDALKALARHAATRRIARSAETGCGATTLLLSHLSENHIVFALDIGSSIANVRESALLRDGIVSFVEGASQRTLPRHHFDGKLQLAVIDGPHAYPFPDLEYYFLYPHLETGSLLVVDDIHIRSINNLFQFLRQDAMFQLEEVVRNTAFFTRTAAPTFNPMGDDWAEQRYNARPFLRYNWRSIVANLLPQTALRALLARRYARNSDAAIEITSPSRDQQVGESGWVSGTALVPPSVPSDSAIWVLARRCDIEGWWPQGNGAVPLVNGSWEVQVNYGGIADVGFRFEVAAVIVTSAVNEAWSRWVSNVERTGEFPPVQLPMAPHVIAAAFQTVYKTK